MFLTRMLLVSMQHPSRMQILLNEDSNFCAKGPDAPAKTGLRQRRDIFKPSIFLEITLRPRGSLYPDASSLMGSGDGQTLPKMDIFYSQLALRCRVSLAKNAVLTRSVIVLAKPKEGDGDGAPAQ